MVWKTHTDTTGLLLFCLYVDVISEKLIVVELVTAKMLQNFLYLNIFEYRLKERKSCSTLGLSSVHQALKAYSIYVLMNSKNFMIKFLGFHSGVKNGMLIDVFNNCN